VETKYSSVYWLYVTYFVFYATLKSNQVLINNQNSQRDKIVFVNKLQLVREDHTYEIWDIRSIKLIKDPKINSNIVDDMELYIV